MRKILPVEWATVKSALRQLEADIDAANARIEELEMQIETALSKSQVNWPNVVSMKQEIKFQAAAAFATLATSAAQALGLLYEPVMA